MNFKLLSNLLYLLILALLVNAASCDNNPIGNNSIIIEEDFIAIVNNKKIPLSLFQSELNAFLQKYRKMIYSDEQQLSIIKKLVIDQLIENELIIQEANRKGIKVTPDELVNITAESLAPYQTTNLSRVLKSGNFTEEEWREKLARKLLIDKLIQQEVIEKIVVTKREIRSYYKNYKSEFIIPSAYRVRNITLSTQKEAKAILTKIKKGHNFVSLVREYSISPDKSVDGDLGYVEKGDLPPELQKEVHKLGFKKYRKQISNVVESQDGYHIFKLLDYRGKNTLNQSKATSLVKEKLIRQKHDEAYRLWISKLKKNAKIDVDKEMLNAEQGY
jgi:peptidyl-prolyl cis-trans isomerase C